jgi:carbamoyl-phosphate synthase large subunit
MARIATELIMNAVKGEISSVTSLRQNKLRHFGVKEAVFPFNMFPEVDPVLARKCVQPRSAGPGGLI